MARRGPPGRLPRVRRGVPGRRPGRTARAARRSGPGRAGAGLVRAPRGRLAPGGRARLHGADGQLHVQPAVALERLRLLHSLPRRPGGAGRPRAAGRGVPPPRGGVLRRGQAGRGGVQRQRAGPLPARAGQGQPAERRAPLHGAAARGGPAVARAPRAAPQFPHAPLRAAVPRLRGRPPEAGRAGAGVARRGGRLGRAGRQEVFQVALPRAPQALRAPPRALRRRAGCGPGGPGARARHGPALAAACQPCGGPSPARGG
mmetsp:Transcript_102171/g.329414  ORF Transcript_102171/g.329414 Transcript_102171/m.329414 type:complete len:259 (-) Transcript_102171:314-1090(-)